MRSRDGIFSGFAKRLGEWLDERKKERTKRKEENETRQREEELSREREEKEREEREERDRKENPCKYYGHKWEVITIRPTTWDVSYPFGGGHGIGQGWEKVFGCRGCKQIKFEEIDFQGERINKDEDVMRWKYKNVIDEWVKTIK